MREHSVQRQDAGDIEGDEITAGGALSQPLGAVPAPRGGAGREYLARGRRSREVDHRAASSAATLVESSFTAFIKTKIKWPASSVARSTPCSVPSGRCK